LSCPINWLTLCISAAEQKVVRVEIVAVRVMDAAQLESGLSFILMKMQMIPARRPALRINVPVS
jgi:hypothetical protein